MSTTPDFYAGAPVNASSVVARGGSVVRLDDRTEDAVASTLGLRVAGRPVVDDELAADCRRRLLGAGVGERPGDPYASAGERLKPRIDSRPGATSPVSEVTIAERDVDVLTAGEGAAWVLGNPQPFRLFRVDAQTRQVSQTMAPTRDAQQITTSVAAGSEAVWPAQDAARPGLRLLRVDPRTGASPASLGCRRCGAAGAITMRGHTTQRTLHHLGCHTTTTAEVAATNPLPDTRLGPDPLAPSCRRTSRVASAETSVTLHR